jgi:hypothetical protein
MPQNCTIAAIVYQPLSPIRKATIGHPERLVARQQKKTAIGGLSGGVIISPA